MNASSSAPSALMNAYGRIDLDFERGEGAFLYTRATASRRQETYLDFATGIATNCLGHSHPKLVAALTEQAGKLWHTSNLYNTSKGEEFARRVCDACFADKVFFSNSGAEALEGSIKLARRYQNLKGHPERYRIISLSNAFHGRTLATMAATKGAKILGGFGPEVDGFDQVPSSNMNALRAAITEETAAILLEPVQGEGGIIPLEDSFLADVRAAADEFGLLVIYDEVQCGFGRTGKLFAHQHSGIAPDIMALAKGIGGGFPMGAFVANANAAQGITPGSHGSTYGGGPLAMAVGLAVLEEIMSPGFLDNVMAMGTALHNTARAVQTANPDKIELVRGAALMMGIKLTADFTNMQLVEALRDQKILSVPAGDNTVRILPPLNIDLSHVDLFGEGLAVAVSNLNKLEKAA